MCGRFLFTEGEALARLIAEARKKLEAAGVPRAVKTGEIFPGDLVPILVPRDGELAPFPAYWGFTNNMRRENAERAKAGKKPLKPKAVFNTRAETAATSYFWKSSLENRRCLVPTCGFHEWQTQPDGGKIEYLFTLPGAAVTAIAGIWHTEPDDEMEKGMVHFSMLTTAPSASIADVHDRMPVVLRPEEYDQWLAGDYTALLDRRDVTLERRAL